MSSDELINDKWIKKLDNQTRHLIDRIGTDRKTFAEVFDHSTLDRLGKFISDKVIDSVDFPVSTGKEANIFRATTPQGRYVALKIYRTSNLTFKHISQYIDGDPRFHIQSKTRRDIIHEWTKKEYKNLKRLKALNIRVPLAIKRFGNILVMQYIGNANTAAPLLKHIVPPHPQEVATEILSFIKIMYQKGNMVHGDLSPYNILWYRQKPYIIDVGQGVLLEHPNSHEFLRRDIYNMVIFFKTWHLSYNTDDIYRDITTTTVKP